MREPRRRGTPQRRATWAYSWSSGAISTGRSAPTAAPTGHAMPTARSISGCCWRSAAIWTPPRLRMREPTDAAMRPQPATWECSSPSRASATRPRPRFGARRRAETRTAHATSHFCSRRRRQHPSRRPVLAPHPTRPVRPRAPRRGPDAAPGPDATLTSAGSSSSGRGRPRRWRLSCLRWAPQALIPQRLSTPPGPRPRPRPTRQCSLRPRSPRRLLVGIVQALAPTRAGLVTSSPTDDPLTPTTADLPRGGR
jgi:hypothetical protein